MVHSLKAALAAALVGVALTVPASAQDTPVTAADRAAATKYNGWQTCTEQGLAAQKKEHDAVIAQAREIADARAKAAAAQVQASAAAKGLTAGQIEAVTKALTRVDNIALHRIEGALLDATPGQQAQHHILCAAAQGSTVREMQQIKRDLRQRLGGKQAADLLNNPAP